MILARKQSQEPRTVGAVTHNEGPRDKWSSSTIQCYNCKKFEHIERYCSQVQGSKQEEAFAPAAVPSTE